MANLVGIGQDLIKNLENTEKKVIKQETKEEVKETPVVEETVVKRVVETRQETRQETFTPIFDVSDRRVRVPNRSKRGTGKAHKIVSLYLMEEEYQLLEDLSNKHGMSMSVYIRTLINNSK